MLPQLFVIGDSISIQYGPHLERMIAGAFSYARKTGTEATPVGFQRKHGENGGDSSMVLDYIRAMRAWEAWRPDVLVLNCGLHDIKTDPATGERQVPLTQYRENLRTILAQLQGLKTRLVWVRTTPSEDAVHNKPDSTFHRHAADVTAYNAAADKLMASAGARIADLFTFTRNLGGSEIFCDHVHFTDPVRAQQAAFLVGVLDGMR